MAKKTGNDISFLHKYLNAYSPITKEYMAQKIWVEYMKKYCDQIEVDIYNNAVAIINPQAKFKVAIEAHVDEICWQVNLIDTNGLIYVKKLGGSDVTVAPSHRCLIWPRKGEPIKGVFGSNAVHLGKTAATKEEDLWVDIGVDTKFGVTNKGIDVGTLITYDAGFEVMNDRYVGRGLDNKIGGYIISQVARYIHKEKIDLPFGLYIMNCSQEESGKGGATIMAKKYNPDLAIVTDVTHDTMTPGISKKKYGDRKLGGGPVVTYGNIIHPLLRDFILDIADKGYTTYNSAGIDGKITVQRKIHATKLSGTDADVFAFANNGIPTALISTPMRYMHTSVESVDKNDVKNLIKLYLKVLTNLTPSINLLPIVLSEIEEEQEEEAVIEE